MIKKEISRPTNLDPVRFAFWQPDPGAVVHCGAERHAVDLPEVPLPVHAVTFNGETPSDKTIGEGLYDFLRQFPDCEHNRCYALLLRDAYPHYLTDLASHAVMLDAKNVEPAYILRKLNCLKILYLVDPAHRGLLEQLCRGFFDLSLEFSELSRCREHLLESMRYGQEILKIDPSNPQALSILAEVDMLFGDTPGAIDKWRRLARQLADPAMLERIAGRIASLPQGEVLPVPLVDELEMVAEAMNLHASGAYNEAAELLEWIEEQGQLMTILPSADFYFLLGLCRAKTGDCAGAFQSFNRAAELDPEHRGALDEMERHFQEVAR